MGETSPSSQRRSHRRVAPLLLAGATVLGLVVSGGVAQAAPAVTPTPLYVVGTSDVSDSGLIGDLIAPEFDAAYPQYQLEYTGVGTGVAIADADAGEDAVLIVHAESTENQFVANGYSYEKAGRPVFWGDYVFLGSTKDPAGVLANASNNIVQAYLDVALAGVQGKADFVSRANTSGTAIQEHQIWALVAQQPAASALTFCTVSSANGGGLAPSTASGACPATISYPSWYDATGLEQAPNIEAGNTCNFANALANNQNDCYVFTDRGTYDCLITTACATGGANTSNNYADPTSLQIVTQNQSASVPGGAYELTNYYHAYVVNPAAVPANSNTNVIGGEDLLNFMTSATVQSQLGSYLAPDSPFHADASPAITASFTPATVSSGQTVTVTGSVTNQAPGTPALASEPVTVSEVTSAVPAGIPVATGSTDAGGSYSVTFTPPASGTYQVSTGDITQLENASLSPTFSDILQPGASSTTSLTVNAAVPSIAASVVGGEVLVDGTVLPSSNHVAGTVTLEARKAGTTAAFAPVGKVDALDSTDGNFLAEAPLAPGTWDVEAVFADPGVVGAGTSTPATVIVGKASDAKDSVTGLSRTGTGVTVKGKLFPAAPKGSTVNVLALDSMSGASLTLDEAVAAVPAKATTFSVPVTLAAGRWVFVVEYVPGNGVAPFVGNPQSALVGAQPQHRS